MKKVTGLGFLLLVCLGTTAQIPDTLKTFADSISYFRTTAKPVQEFNSSKIEYAPSISADGRTMIFESNRGGKYELFESLLTGGKWSVPVPIEAINNFGDSTDLIGGPSVSFDGNTLFFFASFRGGLGSEDIYYSERKGNEWSTPLNLGEPINSTGYEGFPSISADGKTLYFVRQNYVGPADRDLAKLWENKACFSIYSSRKKGGKWSAPELLPYPINQDCEKAPRIMADNRTLIFASNRLGGKGDFDLYQTRLNEVGDWETPVALEFVNTPLADQFSSISAQGDVLYYVYNASDIYTVEIPHQLRQFKNVVIQGHIKNGKTSEGIGAEIIVSDAFTSAELMTIANNPTDGRFTVVLAVGSNYNIEIKKEGYTSKSLFYDLSNATEYQEIDQDILLYQSASLNLNIYDSDLFEPVVAAIKVREVGATTFIRELENNPGGRITLDLPLGKQYEIQISKQNFENRVFVLDVSNLVVYPDYMRDIDMVPFKREVMVNVADLVNNGTVKSKVKIKNKNRDEVIEVNGNETVALRVGDRYQIEATSDQGYAFNSATIEVLPEGGESSGDSDIIIASAGSVTANIEMKLQPLLEGTNLTLKDILFESNSDLIDAISYVELDRVVQLLKQNPSLKIEIDAHTDDVGPAYYNTALSLRRANSVANYLRENKIESERYIAKGLGESQPVFANDTEENRAKNRRVVLKILDI